MAETTALAADAANSPSGADLARVQKFTREPILLDGETLEDLHPGTARRLALDAALVELDEGFEEPSPKWRQEFSLLLGLERVLAEERPLLLDGAELSEHQVDALSGTLAAVISEIEEPGSNRNGNGANGKSGEATGNGAGGEEDDALGEDEEPQDWDEPGGDEEEDDVVAEAADDPYASRRFWFEHATGAGKTVAAVGFVESSRTGGILILTHRRNLVDQFIGEISDRGYADRLSPPLLKGKDNACGPVTVETYQWFVRNAGQISDAYSIVICDEAHTALGEKTSACIRNWQGPVFIGMTATGALIARHVADLFPTQTSRFDLAQAARRGVIAPLRCIRIPPGPGVRTLANVPLRKGEVDQDFDQEELAKLLDQGPFNVAIADLYSSRFKRVPGVIYTAGVKHANNVAAAMREFGINARAVSGETPKRELAEILAAFERGEVDVLCNAMLLAEGWNSPRATICMHLAPTASKRIYQQRVGRVTRRNPGKEAGLVIDLVHPATRHDEAIVTLHSLLDRDVYRGGAIVVGPVRRGRGRRVRVEKRVVPVSADPERRLQVLEREMWRIAVERLDYSEQHVWAALAGARVQPNSWRKAKAMLQHDQAKELRRRFLLTCIQRNRSTQLKLKALGELAATREADPFDEAIDMVGTWQRDQRRAGVRDPPAGARREPDRPPRPGPGLGLAPRRVHPRLPRGVRRRALAGDEAPARPLRQLLRPRPRQERPPPRPGGPRPGPAPRRRPARRCRRPHAGGRGGPARRPDADGPQALRRRPGAAPQPAQGQRQEAPPPQQALPRGRRCRGRGQGRRERRPRGRGKRRGRGARARRRPDARHRRGPGEDDDADAEARGRRGPRAGLTPGLRLRSRQARGRAGAEAERPGGSRRRAA